MSISIIDRYLNFNNNFVLLDNLGIEINSSILVYNNYYRTLVSNPDNIKELISEQINKYISNKYKLINLKNADINYYIENINLFAKKKFREIISELNIEHIISMLDYCSNTNKNYLDCRNQYYKIFYDKIICGLYNPVGIQTESKLDSIINDNWNKINFDNFINFTKTLNKIKYLGQNVDNYIKLISDKFDSGENITKLLDYINKVFFDDIKNNPNNLNDSDNLDNSDNSDNSDKSYITDNVDWVKESTKYNFRFVVDNLKSNGYLMFEEYNKQLKSRYGKPQKIDSIKKDKKLINYFIYIVSKKDSNSVNRKVNEILLRMRGYIYDLEDSYYNNIGYQKIIVKQESEKYKSVDLSSYNRSNCTFNIFKYSNSNSSNLSNSTGQYQYNLDSKVEPYFDIYRKYYNSRYPDREVEFDPIQSTLIVKMKFMEKNYYIHMALIQYIVLDIIYSSDSINMIGLSEKSKINIEDLQSTINSLLQIKIIKRTNAKSIEELKFYINYDFTHDNNKISISSLVCKEDLTNSNDKQKEYMHDRNTIILSNFYDYIKKNKTFMKDTLITELGYKIPFKISQQQIDDVIKILIDKEHITEITLPNPYNSNSQDSQNSQQIYKLVE
jgi:hypothetical protein